ncbi:ISNCY family transposase, partial [Amedibacillus sp. YH-ame6]
LWYGSKKSTLHAAIDDSTGLLTGLFMDNQETLNGYYNVLYQTLNSYGIPYAFLTDRRTVFEYKKISSPNIEKDTFTQFSYACSILGTEIRTTSVAQAKGRVERLFQTLQTRLPIEFRLNGITTLEGANAFLSHYKEKFNKQFSLPIHDNKNVFVKQPDKDRINQILAVLSPRVIDAGHCIKFKNEYYLPLNSNGVKQFFSKGTKALVIEAFDKVKYLTIDEHVYILEKVEKRAMTSPSLDGSQRPKIRKQIIPSMTHPWRASNFEKYASKANITQQSQTCMEA